MPASTFAVRVLAWSAEEIAVALTPFGQVDARHSRWREGAGLGLPIAKALVQLHGERLEIRSAKALGTEVSVVSPPGAEVSNMHGRATAGETSMGGGAQAGSARPRPPRQR